MLSITPFITIKQFAEFVGRNERTVNNILTSKKITDNNRRKQLPPFKRVAGRFILLQEDFEEWLKNLPAENTPIKSRIGRPRKQQSPNISNKF